MAPTTPAGHVVKPIKPTEFPYAALDRQLSRAGLACIASHHSR